MYQTTRRKRRAEEPCSSSFLAVETTTATSVDKTTWSWEAGGRLVETTTTRSVTAAVPTTTSVSNAEEPEAEEWIISDDVDALPLVASSRPLPISIPECPNGGSRKEIAEWHRAVRVAEELAKNDPVSNPPILRERKNKVFDTSSIELNSPRYRELIFRLGRSIVSIASVKVGDERVPKWHYTGIVIGPSESDERVRILTSSKSVCDYDGTKLLSHKLLIRLPNKAIKDGELLFFDPYYDVAVLEISVDMPLRCPSFVSSQEYGDAVFILARDEDSSLMTQTGRVLCHNETSCFECNCYFYLSCAIPGHSRCGLVIDRDGDVIGMAFSAGCSPTAMLPSFIIRKLVEMERNFRCIARPVHGLCLRAVQFLDMQKREEILYDHNIDSGYIVDEVESNSTAEKIGIRHGDVIVSFNGMCSQTLPKLEDYLLSLGWKFLERKIGSSKIVLKLKVYEPLTHQESTVNLPLGFSCLQTVKEKVQVNEVFTSAEAHGIKWRETTPEQTSPGSLLCPRKNSESSQEDENSGDHSAVQRVEEQSKTTK